MLETLRKIIEEQTQMPMPELNKDSVLATDLGLKSFELYDLICKVEEAFDIEIPDRVLERLVTVNDLVVYLEENA